MGRAPCCSKIGLHRGPWTPREDMLLTKYIEAHGEGNWRSLPKEAELLRCGKSCRLRWMNYLRPDIKRGNITPDEDDLIIKLHSLLGNRWSLIAGRLPGRTDNEIKNYWNTHLSKKLRLQGSNNLSTHKKISERIQDLKKRRNNNKPNIKNKKNPNAKIEKIKIYQPKAVRVVSSLAPPLARNDSLESLCHEDHHHYHNFENGGELVLPWTDNFQGVSFFIHGNDDHDSILDNDNGTLDKLYEEYLQLLKTEDDQLQLDSFAESLLV